MEHIENINALIRRKGLTPIMVGLLPEGEGLRPGGAAVVYDPDALTYQDGDLIHDEHESYISYSWAVREDGVPYLFSGFYRLTRDQALKDATWRLRERPDVIAEAREVVRRMDEIAEEAANG